MAHFPDLIEVVPPGGGGGGGGGGGLPDDLHFVGIYWPASAGSTVEAWKIQNGVVTEAPVSSVSAPFTPANGLTGSGEATTHPGEMISDRTVLLRGTSSLHIGFLNDAETSLAVWDCDANTISEVALSPTAGWSDIALCDGDGALHVVYMYSSPRSIEIKNVSTAGVLSSTGAAFALGVTSSELEGVDDKGAIVLVSEGSDATRDLTRYNWDGTTTNLSVNNTPAIVAINNHTAVCWSTIGRYYGGTGDSYAWALWQTSGYGLSYQAADVGVRVYSYAVSNQQFGDLGAPDSAQIGQHISANSSVAGCWRYQGLGANQMWAYRPADGSSFTGTKRVQVYPRLSDSAAAHLVLVADFEGSF